MALRDELLTASYKEVEFIIVRSSTSGGRKDQLHEFPNSDKQTIEDLGLLPRSYRMTGWITTDKDGDNYKQRRDALIAVLEDGDAGELSHPFYGIIANIRCRTFSINEDLTDLGRAEIAMVFDIDDDPGVPKKAKNTVAELENSKDAVNEAVSKDIEDNFSVDNSKSGNFSAAQDKLNDVAGSYDENTSAIVQATNKINEYSSTISSFSANITSLIAKPQALGQSIVNLAETANGLYSIADQRGEIWASFFNFGSSDSTTKGNTSGLAERDKNNNIINESIRMQALTYSYLASAEINFDTTDDLDDLERLLEDQYKSVISSDGVDQSVKDLVTDMRSQVTDFFNAERITLRRIISITTPRLPSRVISYQYYGDSSFGDQISDLNNDANVSFIEGNIQVVTE